MMCTITSFYDNSRTTTLNKCGILAILFVVFFQCKHKMPKAKNKPANQLASAKKTRKMPGSGNRWAYKESLEPITEEDALNRDELLNLECRNYYRIRPSIHVTDKQSVNDEVFRMFQEMLGQDVAFMWQWVRCFILT